MNKKTFGLLIIAGCVLQALDFATTVVGIKCFGAHEVNPIIRLFVQNLPLWAAFKGVCIWRLIVAGQRFRGLKAKAQKIEWIEVAAINAVYVLVVLSNLIALAHLAGAR